MNTMNRLAALNITIEVSAETLADITSLDKFLVSKDDIKKMGDEERRALRKEAEDTMDAWYYADSTDKATYKAAKDCYWLINEVEDEEYREKYMDEFLAYEKRMSEPDFDWDYYSDWHKDMFGYRPHYKRVPVDMAERTRMFETFHRNRGL